MSKIWPVKPIDAANTSAAIISAMLLSTAALCARPTRRRRQGRGKAPSSNAKRASLGMPSQLAATNAMMAMPSSKPPTQASAVAASSRRVSGMVVEDGGALVGGHEARRDPAIEILRDAVFVSAMPSPLSLTPGKGAARRVFALEARGARGASSAHHEVGPGRKRPC